MKEQLVNFKVAKLAKKLGFNWGCVAYYFKGIIEYSEEGFDFLQNYNINPETYSAPTQPMLQKWIREEFGYHISPWYNYTHRHWEITVQNLNSHATSKKRDIRKFTQIMTGSTFEEILEKGLLETLKIIKNEKN